MATAILYHEIHRVRPAITGQPVLLDGPLEFTNPVDAEAFKDHIASPGPLAHRWVPVDETTLRGVELQVLNAQDEWVPQIRFVEPKA